MDREPLVHLSQRGLTWLLLPESSFLSVPGRLTACGVIVTQDDWNVKFCGFNALSNLMEGKTGLYPTCPQCAVILDKALEETKRCP